MKKTKRDDDDVWMKTMTVAAIKPTEATAFTDRRTKKVLAAPTTRCRRRKKKKKKKRRRPNGGECGKEEYKATEKKNEEKGGTKRKGRTMDFDEKADVLDDDLTLEKDKDNNNNKAAAATTLTKELPLWRDVEEVDLIMCGAGRDDHGRGKKKKEEKRNGARRRGHDEGKNAAKELMKKQKVPARR